MKRKSKKSVPNAECKIKNGILHVLVIWDDTSQGQSHYVPVQCLKSHKPLEGGVEVSMKHSKKIWTGRIQLSKRRIAALSLVHGKISKNMVIFTLLKDFTLGALRLSANPTVPTVIVIIQI